MHKSDRQFINDTLVMGKLFYEPSLHKTAQDGMSGILSTVEGAAKSMYRPDAPVESILAFIGPGLLWMFGFKWIAVLYEIAAALGFDWSNFFTTLKDKLKPFLTNLVATKSGDTSHISAIVQEAAASATGDQVDVDKLQDAVDKYGSLNNMLYMKKIARGYGKNDSVLKNKIEQLLSGAAGNRMRKGVLGFIIRFFSWILSAILISLGFAVVGGVASKILGIKKDKTENGSDTSGSSEVNPASSKSTSSTTDKNLKLYLDSGASPELFTTTFNDDNHVWLLHKNISQIKSDLIKWAQELYPQLHDRQAFDASSAFSKTVSLFQERNRNARLDLIAVPTPFKSIKEIVDSFAADVASHMSHGSDEANKSELLNMKDN